jgi:tRNA (cmo5U34)-methyltransferase
MTQYHFDPDTYLPLIKEDIPGYDELQERVADATSGIDAERILDLGAGTGETARRVLERHPGASLVAVDENPAMLERIPLQGIERATGRLQDPLPGGTFDLVVSALAVHHLDPAEKRDLFARIHRALRQGGRLVLADVVAVDNPVIPLSEGYDKPDRAADQLEWLRAAGFAADLAWERDDLALLVGERR